MKKTPPPFIPVDMSGCNILVRNYLDVQKACHIQINYKYTFSMAHCPIFIQVPILIKLQELGGAFTEAVEKKYGGMFLLGLTNECFHLLYTLSKSFYPFWRRRGYKKALLKFCHYNTEGMLGLMESLIDFWYGVKKKALWLSKGTTGRQMYGTGFSWKSYVEEGKKMKLGKPVYI